MTDKEALLEALEALHYCEALNRDVDERKMQAITIIRKLWTEHAMRETQRLGQEIEPDDIVSILACRDMLDAQPVPQRTEQEPVAWLSTDSIGERYLCSDKPLDNDPVQPLYTTPPQRKPLTDEQIFALENSIPDEVVSDRDWCIHFARAIEAAHGIKENQ